MAGDRHGPNSWRNYVTIHTTVMGQFIDRGFVIDDGLRSWPRAGWLLFAGTVECLGGLRISVIKGLDVWRESDRFMVQTFGYSYNVSVHGHGNVFRYDSPHEDHRPYHHRHAYIWNLPGDKGTVTPSADGDWPTLGEVVGEVESWYWENKDELPDAA
jgi:hypothetical protein